MPLISGSGSCFFRQDTKKKFKKKVCLFIIFEVTFESFFKDKKYKRSQKTVGIRFFLLVLLDDRRIRIQIHTSD
jgi:hypothetical protein